MAGDGGRGTGTGYTDNQDRPTWWLKKLGLRHGARNSAGERVC